MYASCIFTMSQLPSSSSSETGFWNPVAEGNETIINLKIRFYDVIKETAMITNTEDYKQKNQWRFDERQIYNASKRFQSTNESWKYKINLEERKKPCGYSRTTSEYNNGLV